jgi:hypothetical protein
MRPGVLFAVHSNFEALVVGECNWDRRASEFVSGCTQNQLLEETISMVKRQSGLAVFALEGPTCNIRHASSSFAERVGWFAQGEPLEGCSILPIIHPDDIAAFLDFTRAAALADYGS